ncbi:MAG: TATA box-binding protein [Candidatus Bathyarchaeota archaeon]|nr:TATA box-binding protein [Candidatus Bathyarchaeota archaeon]
MVKVAIVNVVATASLNQEMDFEELRRFGEIFHDSDVYGGRVAYFKTKGMQGKVSIFSSGKMISVGTKSEEQAQKELQLAKRFLAEKGLIKEVVLEPKTQNIVATADFEQQVNLEELAQKTRVIYEPEQFPGAILRLQQPFKTSILVFASGKVVITGLKDSKQIETVVERIKELIIQ